MLPDWPETKERIGESFLRHVRYDAEARLGILGRIPRVVVHEGDGTGMSRSDGSRTEQEFAEIGATLSIGLDEFAGMPIPVIMERLRDVAEELAGGRAAHAMSVIGEACNEAGNVVDAVGGPLTAELILKSWDQLEIEFDEHEKPVMPTLVIGTGQHEAAREAMSRISEDPELARRSVEIIQRKRENWLAREADRTLVG